MLWRHRDPTRPPRVAFGLYKRMILGIVLIVVATGAAGATAALLQVEDVVHILKEGRQVKFKPSTLTIAQAGDPQTILVLGSDLRRADYLAGLHSHAHYTRGQSDTILLVHMDPHADAITVMSIPRDLHVLIPGFGTDKINAAYSDGGADLTARTIKALLPGIKISHVINVGFDGFSRAVNYMHGVYVDVDRRYYNKNLHTAATDYSDIDIEPGYQKLVGSDALAYVRFRHTDSDLVRAARQQGFVRAAKDQFSNSHRNQISAYKSIASVVGHYIETDSNIATVNGLLRLIHLGAFVANKPVEQIPFQPVSEVNTAASDYLTYDPAKMPALLDAFENPTNLTAPTKASKKSSGSSSKKKKKKSTPTSHIDLTKIPDLTNAYSQAKDMIAKPIADQAVSFPIYVPKLILAGSSYVASGSAPSGTPNPYVYTLYDRNTDRQHKQGHPHSAYRFVLVKNALQGEYYGIEGTDWMNPPLIANPSQVVERNGRKLIYVTSGGHLRYVAWKTDHAVYWVSNTLTNDLTNKQMIGIALSLTNPYPSG